MGNNPPTRRQYEQKIYRNKFTRRRKTMIRLSNKLFRDFPLADLDVYTLIRWHKNFFVYTSNPNSQWPPSLKRIKGMQYPFASIETPDDFPDMPAQHGESPTCPAETAKADMNQGAGQAGDVTDDSDDSSMGESSNDSDDGLGGDGDSWHQRGGLSHGGKHGGEGDYDKCTPGIQRGPPSPSSAFFKHDAGPYPIDALSPPSTAPQHIKTSSPPATPPPAPTDPTISPLPPARQYTDHQGRTCSADINGRGRRGGRGGGRGRGRGRMRR